MQTWNDTRQSKEGGKKKSSRKIKWTEQAKSRIPPCFKCSLRQKPKVWRPAKTHHHLRPWLSRIRNQMPLAEQDQPCVGPPLYTGWQVFVTILNCFKFKETFSKTKILWSRLSTNEIHVQHPWLFYINADRRGFILSQSMLIIFGRM